MRLCGDSMEMLLLVFALGCADTKARLAEAESLNRSVSEQEELSSVEGKAGNVTW